MTDAAIEAAARAIESTMFAPHELPLDAELHAKYCITARAAIAAYEAAMWQPIETAPLGQDLILGWVSNWPTEGAWEMEIGWAGSPNTCPPSSNASNGWFHGDATHWRPLPPPPGGEDE